MPSQVGLFQPGNRPSLQSLFSLMSRCSPHTEAYPGTTLAPEGYSRARGVPTIEASTMVVKVVRVAECCDNFDRILRIARGQLSRDGCPCWGGVLLRKCPGVRDGVGLTGAAEAYRREGSLEWLGSEEAEVPLSSSASSMRISTCFSVLCQLSRLRAFPSISYSCHEVSCLPSLKVVQ